MGTSGVTKQGRDVGGRLDHDIATVATRATVGGTEGLASLAVETPDTSTTVPCLDLDADLIDEHCCKTC